MGYPDCCKQLVLKLHHGSRRQQAGTKAADSPLACWLQGELDAELARELQSYNIDPLAEGMTDDQYADAMAELKRRREAALLGKSRAELARVDHMRTTLMWHIQHVSSEPDAWAAQTITSNASGLGCMPSGSEQGVLSRRVWRPHEWAAGASKASHAPFTGDG